MGIEWLNQIIALLRKAQIPAEEAYQGRDWVEITRPVAGVGLRNLDYRTGMVEFEIRIISPGKLGGWRCQSVAAEALTALEAEGVECRMEPMDYQAGTDCFQILILAERMLLEVASETGRYLQVCTEDGQVAYVTEFSAEQNRQRRLIGTLNETAPVGVTRGTGGWKIRMVQEIPRDGLTMAEPEEPFDLTVTENGLSTLYTGCCWNVVKKQMEPERTRVEWEGFALTGEETASE